ncbi:phosphoglycerate dehydrogenase [Escherichia coli]|nr:phosphoglycerate dehydrogenase [Escherichia coli]EJA8535254.1 phosphoglycerate dehydrogenase [Escherichia coli]MDL7680202.1 phosphoglycerate dehydrogenase [Escherichia coli]
MKNVLVTVPSFSARCVSASKLLRENNFNLIIKNNVEHLLKSESTALRESICAVIAGKDCYQADTLSLLSGVKIISRFGTGIDNIDLRAAQQSGIVVNNAVAEFIIGLIFASMRNIPGSYHAMQNGYWGESHGCELQGKRIGLVGYGNIGKILAKRLSGFDVELLAFDKQPDYQVADKAGVQFVSIEDIFMQSHAIIVLLPFSSELENFISHKYLSMMRNGALIINAARGKLLDEGALLQVIEERNVFAALDVFSSEPLAQFSPLLHAKNIITTPHIAAATVESYQQTGIHVAQSIIDYFAGRKIKNVL